MFDILEADIVVLQETKIQQKDLTDDMSACAPVKAEEGITGSLCPPNSSTPFSQLQANEQIGGYPSMAQLSRSAVDLAALDAEGRAVILEFKAFVLIGVYCPANSDGTRDDFRLGFLEALDARVRNLNAMGRRIFLTGDLNISREELDTANAEASMRKQGLSNVEYISTPSRRLLSQLLEGGRVYGDRDEGRDSPILHDICRVFHPNRKGMFTCWEQKVNARPANCGARIDYVLCSLVMKTWFRESNIQEGLMGSDHCPVYAIMNDTIDIDGHSIVTKDVMNPPGMFLDGKRQREYASNKDLLPTSGRLIPEFSGRRNIRDMFSRKTPAPLTKEDSNSDIGRIPGIETSKISSTHDINLSSSRRVPMPVQTRRKRESESGALNKRFKTSNNAIAKAQGSTGQQSLKGFLKNENSPQASRTQSSHDTPEPLDKGMSPTRSNLKPQNTINAPLVSSEAAQTQIRSRKGGNSDPIIAPPRTLSPTNSCHPIHDPIENKESWSKLFTKPVAPRCEGHSEPCITLLTKKPGRNLGRSFWICPRPLGPSGAKEKNTQWRCQTFIWKLNQNEKDFFEALGYFTLEDVLYMEYVDSWDVIGKAKVLRKDHDIENLCLADLIETFKQLERLSNHPDLFPDIQIKDEFWRHIHNFTLPLGETDISSLIYDEDDRHDILDAAKAFHERLEQPKESDPSRQDWEQYLHNKAPGFGATFSREPLASLQLMPMAGLRLMNTINAENKLEDLNEDITTIYAESAEAEDPPPGARWRNPMFFVIREKYDKYKLRKGIKETEPRYI
ncbi:uncharacterized protein KY384_001088 [Bacidia gigantensis]|uniref:uncharacterized protein n=1 Tax=Bacidia gigantensis TaxID=2732470 RepID=UPI001D042D78|nr:uncharacterized protein KY384_001088 [Bacidia gigantensis]KAG8534244.1 hypothetical protein KY384_001088 [Bacidia gigantensis]